VLAAQAIPLAAQDVRWFDATEFQPARARTAMRPYLPLEAGNQWLYVQRGRIAGDPLTIEITGTAVHNSNTYFRLAGFSESPAWVRYNASGELVEYDPAAGTERLWYAFPSPEGSSWRSHLSEPCVQAAVIRTRRGEIRVPAGAFSPALIVEYQPGACADTGLSEEVFAAGIGLLRRTAITIAGPRTFELLYARVSGRTIAGPELSIALATDRPVYTADLMPPIDPARAVPVMTARLTAKNTTSLPVTLEFPTGQQYDFVIRDSTGRQIFQWSEGKFFTQALTRLTLDGERTFAAEIPLGGADGRPFTEGRYTLEGWLTTIGGKQYAATVPFEIRHVF
jgi:hypothetical protein